MIQGNSHKSYLLKPMVRRLIRTTFSKVGDVMIDIREMPLVLEAINKELNSGNIVEIKEEPHGLAVVRIERKIRYREDKN